MVLSEPTAGSVEAAETLIVMDGIGESISGLGCRWVSVGDSKPAQGRELNITELAQALSNKSSLTKTEWDSLEIPDLNPTDFIKSGNLYFKPDVRMGILDLANYRERRPAIREEAQRLAEQSSGYITWRDDVASIRQAQAWISRDMRGEMSARQMLQRRKQLARYFQAKQEKLQEVEATQEVGRILPSSSHTQPSPSCFLPFLVPLCKTTASHSTVCSIFGNSCC